MNNEERHKHIRRFEVILNVILIGLSLTISGIWLRFYLLRIVDPEDRNALNDYVIHNQKT
jgi:hypothetical protein